ncbi:hypothetical protein GCM10020367_71910 [Streptomyces sannanensis]|uniref:DUF4105 domain-containing protein n=2 Tax=Streptomyces sannanensis TaxID=285536 RepID=A0ABP6SP39_9ACTN
MPARMPVRPARTSASRLGAALVSLSLALLPTTLATPQAHAAGRGQVCFFLDTDSAGGAGHAGWAVKDTARADHYIWGTLQGPTMKQPLAMGTRIAGGTWRDLTAKSSIFAPSRYEFYRCQTTASGSIAHAQRTYRALARTSYDLLTNNCLTGAGEIFRAYSPAMSTRHLPDGLGGRPNGGGLSPTYYIKTRLTSHASGWGPVNRY